MFFLVFLALCLWNTAQICISVEKCYVWFFDLRSLSSVEHLQTELWQYLKEKAEVHVLILEMVIARK